MMGMIVIKGNWATKYASSYSYQTLVASIRDVRSIDRAKDYYSIYTTRSMIQNFYSG
jgi:hypothetical protein